MKNAVEQTQAFVLRQTDYGEHDRILGLYTKKFGKISCFASGAKKSQKRFGSSLDLFSQVNAELNRPQGQSKNLWRLQRIDMLNPHIQLRKNLIALSYASYFSDCVWHLLAEEDPHEDVFLFLENALEKFTDFKFSLYELLEMEIELLHLCGYGPRFFECVDCNRKIDAPKVFFSFSRGGAVCASCTKNDQGLWMPMQIIRTTIEQHQNSEKDFFAVRNVLDRFVTFIVGKELKSQSFRKEVQHEGI